MNNTVVIADDSALLRTMLKDLLERGGYRVVGEAENGEDAVTLASRLKPEFVILDVVMPVKNGLEAAREISRLNLPSRILMCSTLGQDLIVKEALRCGAIGYVMKPLDPASLMEALKAAARHVHHHTVRDATAAVTIPDGN